MTTTALEAFREVYNVDIDPDQEPVEFFLRLMNEFNKVGRGRKNEERRDKKR